MSRCDEDDDGDDDDSDDDDDDDLDVVIACFSVHQPRPVASLLTRLKRLGDTNDDDA